jgi:hypothetical protein
MMNPQAKKLPSGKVQLSWSPDASCFGYRFYRDGIPVSKGSNPSQASVTFAAETDGKPHSYGVARALEQPAESVVFPAPAPVPSLSLTGGHFVRVADYPTVAALGWKFVLDDCSSVADAKAKCDAAKAAGLKLIIGPYPKPYSLPGGEGKGGAWTISQTGQDVIRYLHSRMGDAVMALFVYNEPYWIDPLGGGSSADGTIPIADLRSLRTAIRAVAPIPVYHDIGIPAAWAPGGWLWKAHPGIGNKYADQAGVADYVGCWEYPFKTDGSYRKQTSLDALKRETAFVRKSMGAEPIWLVQTHGSSWEGVRYPTDAELADYVCACRAAEPTVSLSMYTWGKENLYPGGNTLSGHPSQWPQTRPGACG